ncbi:MAG: RecX family transcriptional regulator [Phycisphaeraceae bacterium]|nr:RecX family transcriptional regulator [Phycisphaeraceae bacterium]
MSDIPVISELRPDPAKPGCVVARIRGRKPWRIDAEAAAGLGLVAGREVCDTLLERIEHAAANCKGRLRLQSRLAVRALSRIEAQALMRRAGASGDYARTTVEDFVKRGWIDDDQLARSVARAEAARPVGAQRVVARVARRGVGSGLARAAADEAVKARTRSALELAIAAARAQMRKLPPRLGEQARQRRVLGFLARQGFDQRTALQAVREARAAE